MEPVAPRQSAQAVRRQATKLDSDSEHRASQGFRVGAGLRRAQQAVAEREEELVSGYRELTYAGIVTLTAPTLAELGPSQRRPDRGGRQRRDRAAGLARPPRPGLRRVPPRRAGAWRRRGGGDPDDPPPPPDRITSATVARRRGKGSGGCSARRVAGAAASGHHPPSGVAVPGADRAGPRPRRRLSGRRRAGRRRRVLFRPVHPVQPGASGEPEHADRRRTRVREIGRASRRSCTAPSAALGAPGPPGSPTGGGRWAAVCDPKGEYRLLAEALGLQQVRLYPGGPDRVNPLDAGPSGAAQPGRAGHAPHRHGQRPADRGAAPGARPRSKRPGWPPRSPSSPPAAGPWRSRPWWTCPPCSAPRPSRWPPRRASAADRLGRGVRLGPSRAGPAVVPGPAGHVRRAAPRCASTGRAGGWCWICRRVHHDPDALAVVMIPATSWLQALMADNRPDAPRKVQVIEECWAMLRHERVAFYLQACWKLCRALRGGQHRRRPPPVGSPLPIRRRHRHRQSGHGTVGRHPNPGRLPAIIQPDPRSQRAARPVRRSRRPPAPAAQRRGVCGKSARPTPWSATSSARPKPSSATPTANSASDPPPTPPARAGHAAGGAREAPRTPL